MNIVLDMDNTLITHDKRGVIYSRPFLKDFLTYCFDHFDRVSIWTAANRDWFDYVYHHIFEPIMESRYMRFDFVFTREKCTFRTDPHNLHLATIKPLKKVWSFREGYTRSNTLIVDDNPETFQDNFDNAIIIRPFVNPCTSYVDCELLHLISFLRCLEEHFQRFHTVENIDKFNWREYVH